ncbi:hypothetical protein HGRIS_013222 [Hohenbuehelia grisea]|uniref:TPR-like protein n=1 Tax=Hohenbuehelia grisea TaxID=104357 RepID=A0ABR3IV24_9AGAR
MAPQDPPTSLQHLAQRFQSLIWSCLDADLTRTAIFYAERYYATDKSNHDARHLYATSLLREGQTYSAMYLVNIPRDEACTGCLELKAKCCTALGRHRQAREALEETLLDPNYASSSSAAPRHARAFPEEAALRCRAGTMALKGNLTDQAVQSFRQALSLNPFLWEAFEGLCAAGAVPDVDEIYPPRPSPAKRVDEPQQSKPIATGAGFFTPDAGGGGSGGVGNLFRAWKAEGPSHSFLMGQPSGPRDSIATNESSFHFDTSFRQFHRPTRSQPAMPSSAQPPMSRPLSSADEAGPVAKKMRSTSRHVEPSRTSKSTKLTTDEPVKKSSTSSRTATVTGKGHQPPGNPALPIRRSTRLGGPTTKPSHSSKHSISRDRRRQPTHAPAPSVESEMEEEVLYSPSPPAIAHSPRSEESPASWAAQEQAAQEAYESEVAEHFLYEMMRHFASATRALAVYNCRRCISDLALLPHAQQQSASVLAMVGRAHYESLDYASAERAFRTVRDIEPYRLWDMEVYSTLLWHLQRSVELSFLAQELMSVDSQCPQAWIAVGNLFSLQKERPQALTCFRRAAQMDPTCAYAYTLSGHESIDEDLDKAINFFQSALRADPRHYNAWYGLGTCYLRMSKVRLAEFHYRKAVEIHPNNAVLLGCVALAVERRGDQDSALALFDEAVRLSPDNALVRYRRAKILISMKRYNPAIDDLEMLRRITPDESNVVFQLAKVYRLIGDQTKSAQMLAVARDISPKSLQKMKKLLETVKDEGIDDSMDEG